MTGFEAWPAAQPLAPVGFGASPAAARLSRAVGFATEAQRLRGGTEDGVARLAAQEIPVCPSVSLCLCGGWRRGRQGGASLATTVGFVAMTMLDVALG